MPPIIKMAVATPLGEGPRYITVTDPLKTPTGPIHQWYPKLERALIVERVKKAQEEAAFNKHKEKMARTVELSIAIACETQPGQRVWLTGSDSSLGSWKPAAALKLKWSEGHIWRGVLELPGNMVDGYLECKALLQNETDGSWIWQAGGNYCCDVGAGNTSIAFAFNA